MRKTTESDSGLTSLETKNITELSQIMNQFDAAVHLAIEKELPAINATIEQVVRSLESGGKIFYIGAGTSGRLGILDASECPPTFGVPHDLFNGIIAGGDSAIRKAVEFAEDDLELGWKDLQERKISTKDTVIGIAASGTTPYVIGALKQCQIEGISTGCITCNPDAPVLEVADFPICVEVGPEFVRGSTRLKAGTAQKLVLNMISTISMIKMGKVVGNKMVDMQLSNKKLIQRGTSMILEEIQNITPEKARETLLEQGSVRAAISFLRDSSM